MFRCESDALVEWVGSALQGTSYPYFLERGSPSKRNDNNSLQMTLPCTDSLGVRLCERSAIARHRARPMLFRFGAFEADVQSGELTKQGKRVQLQDQPFQLLVMLLEKPGEVVTREALRCRLWPQTTVDFDHGLNKAISKIREALGDSSGHPRFVETVARRGYRFLADVAIIESGPLKAGIHDPRHLVVPNLLSPSPAAASQNGRRKILTRRLFGFASALVVACSASWALYHRFHSLPAIRSLAVLPLENLSEDPSQDYFADGMTDELITRLAQISALRVISRTSAMTYKNSRKPLAAIAKELDVDAVVEGSVSRSGERVRITAQLIDARNDNHIWAERYNEDIRDTLLLQSRVTRAIAEQISTTLKPKEPTTLIGSKTINPEAYEAYLKGRYFWNKRTGDGLRTAIEHFNHAIEIDPTYAEAYSGLADAYAVSGDWKYRVLPSQEAFTRAKAAAAKALTFDDTLGEAHASLAFALDLYGWDWEAAEAEYKKAIKFNPGYATAHQWYSWHLFIIGKRNRALSELKIAESLDPLSLIIMADIADALCVAHQYDEAIKQSQKTLEMDPNFAVGHYELGQALAQKHMYDEAIAEFKRAISISGHSGAADSNLGYAYAASGQREEAIKIINDLESRYHDSQSVDADIALIYVGLGERGEAMMRLNKAYESRFKASILLRPAFDALRSDAKFQNLLRQMGLPASRG
jgi:TolB-like protein/DNA-binding winged helix-turn-helix (wHTH) protein/Flp pilus assembly protein TadD